MSIVIVEDTPELIGLRAEFTALTNFSVATGGTNIASAEERQVRLAMMELGFERETETISNGWRYFYSKETAKGCLIQNTFEHSDTESLIFEYTAAISAIKAYQGGSA